MLCSLLVLYPFLLTTLLLMPHLLIDRFIYSAGYTNKIPTLNVHLRRKFHFIDYFEILWNLSLTLLFTLSKSHSILLLLTGRFTEPWNFGKPTQKCESCGAILCYEERNVKSRRLSQPKFSLCCSEWLIYLPLLKHAPLVLEELLNYSDPSFVIVYLIHLHFIVVVLYNNVQRIQLS